MVRRAGMRLLDCLAVMSPGTDEYLRSGEQSPAAPPRRVLIVGAPRSGTTWVGHALERAPGVIYVHEPDNDSLHPLAIFGVRHVGHVATLKPGQAASAYD